jgi:hypothetical protein
MKKVQEPVIRLVHKDSKSRKGWFWYIKYPGHKDRLYRTYEGVSADDYVKHYESLYVKKTRKKDKKAPWMKKRGKQRQVKGVRKAREAPARSVASTIKKGMAFVTTKDAYSLYSDNKVLNQNMELMKDMVRDPELLKLICREENMVKIKERFEHNVKIWSQGGELIGTYTAMNRTLRDVVTEIMDKTKKGMYVQGYNPLKIKNYKKYNEGEIDRVEILTVFRK